MKKRIIAVILCIMAVFTAMLSVGCTKNDDDLLDGINITFVQYGRGDVIKRVERNSSLDSSDIPTIVLPEGFEHLQTKWSITNFENVSSDTEVYAEYYLDGERAYFVEFAIDTEKSNDVQGYYNLGLKTRDIVKAGYMYDLPNIQNLLNVYGDAYWRDPFGNRYGTWSVTRDNHITFEDTGFTISSYNYNAHIKFFAVIDSLDAGDWSDIY